MQINSQKPDKAFIKNIFSEMLLISIIIPLIIFYVFDYFKMPLTGLALSGCWSLGVVIIKFIKEHTINVLALVSSVFSVVGLIATLITYSPTFYLTAPIFNDIFYSLIFFGSLFFKRPLIQIFAEETAKNSFSEELKKKPKYRRTWILLTAGGGILTLMQAVVRIILFYSLPMKLYYTVSLIICNISTPLFLIFCVWFPKWYWKREAQ